MTLTAFRGATSYEVQIGCVWLKLLRPRFWCRGNLSRLVCVGIDTSDDIDDLDGLEWLTDD